MTMLASQITSLTVVYSIVYSGVNLRKHQSSASLAFVWEIHRGPVNFPHKWPVTRKMFPFDDVIMILTVMRNVIVMHWPHVASVITAFKTQPLFGYNKIVKIGVFERIPYFRVRIASKGIQIVSDWTRKHHGVLKAHGKFLLGFIKCIRNMEKHDWVNCLNIQYDIRTWWVT